MVNDEMQPPASPADSTSLCSGGLGLEEPRPTAVEGEQCLFLELVYSPLLTDCHLSQTDLHVQTRSSHGL